MIFGIGTDIVRSVRIEEALQKREGRFAEKILGPEEFEAFQRRSEPHFSKAVRYLATRFAAKEALSKAMGTGFRKPLSWHGVQVLNSEAGRPMLVFGEEMKAWFSSQNLCAHVTISDEHEYAVAFVVIESQDAVCQK